MLGKNPDITLFVQKEKHRRHTETVTKEKVIKKKEKLLEGKRFKFCITVLLLQKLPSKCLMCGSVTQKKTSTISIYNL